MYTQGTVPYRNEHYHVNDIMNVKASVVAACQKMVRENIFGSLESAGSTIRDLETDEAFIIEPLLNAQPASKEEDQEKQLMALANGSKIASK